MAEAVHDQAAQDRTVETPRVPVTDTYHGVSVTEDYRWLEDPGSEQTRAWTEAQDRRTRNYLRSLPFYDAMHRRVGEILKAESVTYESVTAAGPTYFALKSQPPKQQPYLVVLSTLDDVADERVLVDPNEIDASGATTIDWYAPSPNGSLVAVSMSAHGTEDGTVEVFRTTSAERTGDTVPRVNGGTAGGSLAWRGDSSGFWYTRYPSPGERAEQDLPFYEEIWYHRLGVPVEDDRRELAGVFAEDRISESFLSSSPDGRWVLDRVQKGDGGQWQVFARAQADDDRAEAAWWRVADIDDRVVSAAFGPGALYLLSRDGAPRGKVLRLPLQEGATVESVEELVPEGEVTIEGPPAASPGAEGNIVVTDTGLWVLQMDGGMSSLRSFDLDGTDRGALDTPPVSAIEGLVRLSDNEVAFATESYHQPRSWWRATGHADVRRTALATRTPLDLSGITVTRELATSRDGTKVPVTVITGQDVARDGSAPAILYGYGGYGISLKPWFNPRWLPWLEQSGVVAIAHIRGGGEYGEAWHHAGRLTTKQNAFDDFAACAEHLVTSRITTTDRLALMGGSNGGLLMGAVLTQHPALARAVVAMVPVMDVLRSELEPNGAFNIPEFGTVQDPEQFQAMYAYSPYHRVQDGVAYPAVLLTAGEFDPRVPAYHAKKMAARLMSATSSGEPVLLRVESSGHGIGSSLDQQVGELTDVYAFIFDRLGLAYAEGGPGR